MNKQTILRFLKYIGITFLTLFIALFLLGGGIFLSTLLARLQPYLKVN